MGGYTKEELQEALRAIESTIAKCAKIQPKLKPGTAQHTLLSRRLKALTIAHGLIKTTMDSAGSETL